MAKPDIMETLNWIFLVFPYYSVQKGFDNLISIVETYQKCPNSTEARQQLCESAEECCGM